MFDILGGLCVEAIQLGLFHSNKQGTIVSMHSIGFLDKAFVKLRKHTFTVLLKKTWVFFRKPSHAYESNLVVGERNEHNAVVKEEVHFLDRRAAQLDDSNT